MKPSKRGGERMNEDRISKLPEVLIREILSQLPTKSAVATSVLSKQWQFLWKMMPKLKFDSCDHKGEVGTFSNNVCKSLLSHRAPFIESLHLSFTVDSCDAMDIGMWVGIACAQHVRKLLLDVECKTAGTCFILPRSMYNCEILETLTLKGLIYLKNVPSQVCLKSLKTLHLHPRFLDKEAPISFVTFLSGCPSLENLAVNLSDCYKVNTLAIPMPSLQRLTIYYDKFKRHTCSYVFNAPSLKYLKIERNCRLGLGAIENVTTLVEANINDVSDIIDGKILRYLTSVKRLSLEILPFKFELSSGIIFNQLVNLEIYTSQEAWWNLLTSMLSSSPKLQVLKLINSQEQGWRKTFMSYGNLNQPENFPKCLLFHLETFMYSGYNKFLVIEEKKVARYILANAYRLKKATFSLRSMNSGDRGELIKNLNCVVRASDSCELLFK